MDNKAIPAIILLLLTLGCNAPQQTPSRPSSVVQQTQAKPDSLFPTTSQNFDYYLLNLSWSPEFCHSHPTAAECAQHPAFILHGLWPQNLNGTYPQNCSNAPGPRNPSQHSDIYPDPGLLKHEWRTHGTCSGLSPDAFFTLASTAFHSIVIPPELIQLTHQISMPPEQILALFTASNPNLSRENLVLSCGNNYLTAVEVCLDKNLHPTACGPIRSCRANTVRVPPPQ
ncbi:ribonuclease T2 [Edaphobacter aggregans]|uniref:Ribonuclease T2 n=1 Tax=Edaphobacter aggregans TaxID=570835 RepID=A0A3R9Q8J1_9BACT|nr:ribonuclease T2 [Edaphobacter aggregans]RSL15839.1 ribonuclease T2 [Edaphobacter aggregans]